MKSADFPQGEILRCPFVVFIPVIILSVSFTGIAFEETGGAERSLNGITRRGSADFGISIASAVSFLVDFLRFQSSNSRLLCAMIHLPLCSSFVRLVILRFLSFCPGPERTRTGRKYSRALWQCGIRHLFYGRGP